ncbi:hypothetical protein VTJ83DRAFT_1812 [Remersonia thermophila]|uniref:Nuclease S1 n=1 Tax=Remersonia thermophila TaxID=72144 RepID=A0ABR4DH01_9PEZI
MRLSSLAVAIAAVAPGALAWGGFGHITTAYLASDFVSPKTTAYLQALLRNDTPHYLAGVATWADSVRYTRWGRFSSDFHFIDAKDAPPSACGVDFERDCKKDRGCVVSALRNYTARMALDPARKALAGAGAAAAAGLPAWERAIAAKFVVHFVGDIHQPLHTENVARGGNGIPVVFDGRNVNLHHVWDTSIAEKWVGGIRRRPYEGARRWADELAREIRGGRYAAAAGEWLRSTNISDPHSTAMAWASESNAIVCSHVFTSDPEHMHGQELGGEYYEKAAPVVELQVARAGYRLAAWLDMIVEDILGGEEEAKRSDGRPPTDDL